MSQNQIKIGMSSDQALKVLTELEKALIKSRRIGTDDNGLLVAWRCNDGTEFHFRREKRPAGEMYYIYNVVKIGV